jgi:hypothetical protein
MLRGTDNVEAVYSQLTATTREALFPRTTLPRRKTQQKMLKRL